jgi:hypothetical protein
MPELIFLWLEGIDQDPSNITKQKKPKPSHQAWWHTSVDPAEIE